MELLPALESKGDVLGFYSRKPALLEAFGSSEPAFTVAEARHLFDALHANGFTILGFEIWRSTPGGFELDVEGIWLSHGSDARWNHADAIGFLRIAAPGRDDLVTIQFQEPAPG
jgi:hypothetical protein